MAGECIDGVPRRKLNVFILCDIWPSHLWLSYYAFINKRRIYRYCKSGCHQHDQAHWSSREDSGYA